MKIFSYLVMHSIHYIVGSPDDLIARKNIKHHKIDCSSRFSFIDILQSIEGRPPYVGAVSLLGQCAQNSLRPKWHAFWESGRASSKKQCAQRICKFLPVLPLSVAHRSTLSAVVNPSCSRDWDRRGIVLTRLEFAL